MKKITATAINPQSWILTEWGNRVGVLTLETTGTVCLLSVDGISSYNSLQELNSARSWDIQFNNPEAEEAAVDKIGELPVRHSNPQNIQTNEIVSYTKSEKSNTRFAAGYWGIQYSHGWVPGFCPKLETLLSYPRIGPFTTKLELNTLLSKNTRKSQPS